MTAAAYPVVGFTGTKDGLTVLQLAALEQLLGSVPAGRELHHGDCVGADDAAHRIARALSWRVVVHPPLNQRRACGHLGDVRLPPADFLQRNDAIVRATGLLVACPATDVEQERSGTWSTVRRARARRRPIGLVLPDGTVRWERPDLATTASTSGFDRVFLCGRGR